MLVLRANSAPDITESLCWIIRGLLMNCLFNSVLSCRHRSNWPSFIAHAHSLVDFSPRFAEPHPYPEGRVALKISPNLFLVKVWLQLHTQWSTACHWQWSSCTFLDRAEVLYNHLLSQLASRLASRACEESISGNRHNLVSRFQLGSYLLPIIGMVSSISSSLPCGCTGEFLPSISQPRHGMMPQSIHPLT